MWQLSEGTACKLWGQKLQPREEILTPALLTSVRLCQVVSCGDWPKTLVINKMEELLLEGQAHYLNDALAL